MKTAASDRRVSFRHSLRIPICIRRWKTAIPEERGESENLSGGGILFATDSAMPLGTVLEVFLNMPEAVSGEPTGEWLCSGHVVRVEPIESPRGKLGVSVQFDLYEVSRGIGA